VIENIYTHIHIYGILKFKANTLKLRSIIELSAFMWSVVYVAMNIQLTSDSVWLVLL